jgi:hypothetical protein
MTYRERKSHIDQPLFRLLCSGVSQRACARVLQVRPDTIAKKIRRLAARARLDHEGDLKKTSPVSCAVFDEMETFEHSKCKPVSIAISVIDGDRKILAAIAAQMPAKGLLAGISRQKYGPRKDERPRALRMLMSRLKEVTISCPTLKSDECPRYPKYIAEAFEGFSHLRYKGRRGCVVGQGELKEGGFDPLFSLNHTCAMIRDGIKRLSRRTWCTTKKIECLQDLLDLFVWFHNQRLLRPKAPVSV